MKIPAWLQLPASHSAILLALLLAVFELVAALWAILYQGVVIAYQREVIRLLSPLR